MTDPHHPKRQRLADREGLRIDMTDLAITLYRLAVDKTMTTDDARSDLAAALGESYITESDGREMVARFRNRQLNIDMIAQLTRLSPTHVRCDDVQIRGRKRANQTSGYSSQDGHIRRVPGKGAVRSRADGSGVDWRSHGSPEWRPTTLRALAREWDADSDLWRWLKSQGHARPSPSGPSGETTSEADRGTKQCMLRLTEDEIARLDRVAAREGCTRSEIVRRWIYRAQPED